LKVNNCFFLSSLADPTESTKNALIIIPGITENTFEQIFHHVKKSPAIDLQNISFIEMRRKICMVLSITISQKP